MMRGEDAGLDDKRAEGFERMSVCAGGAKGDEGSEEACCCPDPRGTGEASSAISIYSSPRAAPGYSYTLQQVPTMD
jgi:hypothetical protein